MYKLFRTLIEAIIFGLIVLLIGLIIANLVELWIPIEPSCKDNYFYEISLFLTGFAIHLINVYVVKGWLSSN